MLNNTRITNAVFKSDTLFSRRNNRFREISSLILSSTVSGAGKLQNLNPPVTINFQINSVSYLH